MSRLAIRCRGSRSVGASVRILACRILRHLILSSRNRSIEPYAGCCIGRSLGFSRTLSRDLLAGLLLGLRLLLVLVALQLGDRLLRVWHQPVMWIPQQKLVKHR